MQLTIIASLEDTAMLAANRQRSPDSADRGTTAQG
jgi:hypothetical protein